jgi:RNA polymerase sigma-54 factor
MGDLKLNVKLSQQLVMTPQLQQAIKLLQLSRMELQETINKELLENPVLEETIDSADPNIVKETKDNVNGGEEYLDSFDANSSAPPTIRTHRPSYDEQIFSIENIATRAETLYDHLLWQLKMTGFSKKEEDLGEKIIQNVNDDGYLSVDFDELAKASGLSYDEAEEVLLKVQEFDPVGVAARNLKECLLQQARQLNLKDGKLISLIKTSLSELEKRNYGAIARKLRITQERALELAKIVLSLDPKPGRAFSLNEAQYIVPDIYVFKIGDEYVISLNEDGIPRLRVSTYYKNMATDKKSGVEKKDKEYLQERLRSAVALIRSIQNRQKTIYKVTEAIVKKQKDFLEQGVSKLKPMILREIAEEVGMHESTISRVTTNKYVHTPQGLFELKFFFNNPVSSVMGSDDVASESVRQKIKEIVSSENARSPYSDQDIADELKKSNIDVARRTVAKYREMMGILPSSKRKKHIV